MAQEREADALFRHFYERYRMIYGAQTPLGGEYSNMSIAQAYRHYIRKVMDAVGGHALMTPDIIHQATQMFDTELVGEAGIEGLQEDPEEEQREREEALAMDADRINRAFEEYVLPISQRYGVPMDDLFHHWRRMVGDHTDTDGIRMFAQYMEHQLQSQDRPEEEKTSTDD